METGLPSLTTFLGSSSAPTYLAVLNVCSSQPEATTGPAAAGATSSSTSRSPSRTRGAAAPATCATRATSATSRVPVDYCASPRPRLNARRQIYVCSRAGASAGSAIVQMARRTCPRATRGPSRPSRRCCGSGPVPTSSTPRTLLKDSSCR